LYAYIAENMLKTCNNAVMLTIIIVFCSFVGYIIGCSTVCLLSVLLFVGCHVFTNKDDAIKLIKEKKGGRFKPFSKRVEAEEFSMNVSGSSTLTHAVETVASLVKFYHFCYSLHFKNFLSP